MRTRFKLLMSLVGVLSLCTRSEGITPGVTADKYHQIPERNIFGLRPALPAPAPPTNPSVALPKLTLTGITTILGSKVVLIKEQPVGGKPGEVAKELSFILAEGQREGDLEVLRIDETAREVEVNNLGTRMTLTFERDGTKAQSTPPPSPVATTFGMPSMPAASSSITPSFQMPRLPSRDLRIQQTATNPYASYAPGLNSPVPNPAATNLVSNPPPLPAPPNDLTPEEQIIVQELRRQTYNTNPPPLPGGIPGSAGVSPTTPGLPKTFAPGGTVPSQTGPLLPQ